MATAASELRVILLGKTGSGKSSLGNTLLGYDGFRVARGMCSGTEKCQWSDEMKGGGTHLQVTDTPGLCDTHRPQEDVLAEIAKSVAVASPGPHVILMVLRCDMRFTWEEYNAYRTLRVLFGDGIRNFMILVFTGADALGHTHDEQQNAIAGELKSQIPQLSEVISDSGGRFIAVSNRGSRQDRDNQAGLLINMMQGLKMRNGGRYFSNPMCEDVNQQVDALIQNNMHHSGLSRRDAERAAKKAIVQETAGSSFFKNLLTVVKHVIVPICTVAVQLATLCSVM